MGARPGVTALATTAVFATGARITPTLPLRAGLRGISVSCVRGCVIGLDRGDYRLNGDPAVGDELPTGSPRGGNWVILTASAFVTIIVPLLVFFGLQRYLVRGLLAGSVKGG
jgi:hypothetical protein